MKNLQLIILFIFVFSIFSCNNELDVIAFEKKVLHDVFEEIADSIYRDRRKILPPPVFGKPNGENREAYLKRLNAFTEFRESITKSEDRILLAVVDTIKPYKSSNEFDGKYYLLDLSQFKYNKKFDFKPAKLFPDQLYWDINDFKSTLPVGIIQISRIRFNKTKTNGILRASSSCGGGKCSQNYEIEINQTSEDWRIKKITETSMS